MIDDPISLLNSIKTHLENDSNISYIETVSIQQYKKENLPEFDKYALLVSLSKDFEELIANRTRQKTCLLEIVCIVRNFDSSKSLIGTGAGETGIIRTVKLVKQSLFEFGEAHPDELVILYDEMGTPVDFKFHKFPVREDFFHEVIIPYEVRLKHTTF